MNDWGDVDPIKVLNGFLFAVASFLAWVGARAGFRSSQAAQASAPSIEVMGDVIVIKKIDDLIKAVDMNTLSLSQKAVAIQKNTAAIDAYTEVLMEVRRAMDRNTEHAREAGREAVEQAERLRRDMRELGDRLARGGR